MTAVLCHAALYVRRPQSASRRADVLLQSAGVFMRILSRMQVSQAGALTNDLEEGAEWWESGETLLHSSECPAPGSRGAGGPWLLPKIVIVMPARRGH